MVFPAAAPPRTLPLRAESGAADSVCNCAKNGKLAVSLTCTPSLAGAWHFSSTVYLHSAVHPTRHDTLVSKKPDTEDVCFLPKAVLWYMTAYASVIGYSTLSNTDAYMLRVHREATGGLWIAPEAQRSVIRAAHQKCAIAAPGEAVDAT